MFARQQNISYKKAYRWWRKGILNGIQEGKLILIDGNNPLKTNKDNQIEKNYLTIKDSLQVLENANKNLNKQFGDIIKYLGLVTNNTRCL